MMLRAAERAAPPRRVAMQLAPSCVSQSFERSSVRSFRRT